MIEPGTRIRVKADHVEPDEVFTVRRVVKLADQRWPAIVEARDGEARYRVFYLSEVEEVNDQAG